MNNKLYKLMNWPEIEEIVYSDGCDPHRILGPHKVGNALLIQAFRPDAKSMRVLAGPGTKPKSYDMELADDEGFFAVLIPYSRENLKYEYEITRKDGSVVTCKDPYRFPPVIGREDSIKLSGGVHYSVFDRLGAHPMRVDGIWGVNFAVWAPNVARISVVGPFNNYDGRLHQMRMNDTRGIFEIFIPDLKQGCEYQYEVKTKDGFLFVKPDPFTMRFGKDRENVSAVYVEPSFPWSDEKWMEERKAFRKHDAKLTICELSLEKFDADHGGGHNYETLAPVVAEYLLESGFNTVELMPVMEHVPEDPYAVTGYFAVCERFGTADQFKAFVNLLHENGIRVVMDFPATFFAEQNASLRNFTGTALYEYGDSRAFRPGSGYHVFDYGRKEVQNYLHACALYWLDRFHLDGLRLPDIAKILYLDYDKQPGEWMPNIYGGNENLEAEEFIRNLNAIVNKKDVGILMICKETACYPQVTGLATDGGLGFDYKWNNGWSRDFFTYIMNDPIYRAAHHGELTFSLIYQYSERFILAFSHEDIDGLKPMLDLMPGDEEQKAANARFALAYLYLHPGRKMVFRGISDFPAEKGKLIGRLIRDLNHMYLEHPALFVSDDDPEGFSWINDLAAEACYMAFMRRENETGEQIVVCANMAGVEQEILIGVPRDGKYYEIVNTDSETYGGSGRIYGDSVIEPEMRECDGRPFALRLHMAPLSVIAMQYVAYTEEENRIREVRHEAMNRMEQEQQKTRDLLEEKRQQEEEKLLQELRAKYEEEISAREQAIADKYRKQEEIKIQNILSGASGRPPVKGRKKKS